MALTKPFAENGDKKAIPQTTSDGSVSFDRGFGSFYALPPEEGGLFIDRAQFNQLMFDTTSQVLDNKQAITTKANANATVNLTGNQTIAGIKTFSSPVVVPNGTANTHAVNLSQLNTKANQDTTYTKTEVNNLVNAKIDSTKATKLLTENLVKTVGASGADFANLRQALEWAGQYSYSGGRFKITLRCNADMPIPGAYLPIGEALIVIDGQNNTFNCDNGYFMATESSAQNITIKNFTLNYNSITNNQYGCAFQFTNTGVSLQNITINIANSTIGNTLIINQRSSSLYIENMIINCSGNSSINSIAFTGGFAKIYCPDLVVNTDNLRGQITSLFTFDCSNGNLHQYGTQKPAYPTDKIGTQIRIWNNSIVVCGNRFNDSKLSVAPNTLTNTGIIFKS